MAETVRVTIVVTGRVQGVFFRSSALQEAQRLGVSGYVQNLPDGSVEAVAEGAESAVDQFIDWCRVGSAGAQVANVATRFSPPKGDFRTFSVVR